MNLDSLDSRQRFPRVALGWNGRMRWATAASFARVAAHLPEAMQGLRAPLLVMHDPLDQVCDFAGSRELINASPSADKTLLKVPEGLHTLLLNEGPFIVDTAARWLLQRTGSHGRLPCLMGRRDLDLGITIC